jgi:hypothetical protein
MLELQVTGRRGSHPRLSRTVGDAFSFFHAVYT